MRNSFEYSHPIGRSGSGMDQDHHSRRESNWSYNSGAGSRSTGTGIGIDNKNSYNEKDGAYAQPYNHRSSFVSEQSSTGTITKASKASVSRKSFDQSQHRIPPTIAVFGVGSKTATHFIRTALDAGYHVRAMIIHQSLSSSKKSIDKHLVYPRDEQVHELAQELRNEFSPQEEQSILHWVRADCIYDINAIRRTIRDVQYVVCMMQDNAPISSFTHYIDPTITNARQQQQHYRKNSMRTIPMDPLCQSVCTDHSKPITSFLKVLYPLMMEEKSIKVFLYQANSVASDVKGKTPIFSKALKTVSSVRSFLPGRRSNISISFTNSSSHGDQNSVVREIGCHHRRRNRLSLGDSSTGSYAHQSSFSKDDVENREANVSFNGNNDQENMNNIGMNHVKFAKFSYIITRPTTYLKDGPSLKKVSASKSQCLTYSFHQQRLRIFIVLWQQPGPFPIAHIDLAEFTLNALLNPKLYNSCPYVVADSF